MRTALRRLAAGLLFLALLPPAAAAAASENPSLDRSGDPVVASATAVTALRSGPWSQASTWGRSRPRAGERVVIPAGKAVVLDVSTPHVAGVQVDGTLRFARKNLKLHARYVMVHGRFEVGTDDKPFQQRATIFLDGPRDGDAMGMGTSVLGVMGGVLDLHGQREASPWTRLAQRAEEGDWRIRVRDADGWRRGDEIAIASTTFDPFQAERRTIDSVSGNVVTLDRPLSNYHHAGTEWIGGRKVQQRAEVALLTRSILVRGPGDAPSTGMGGHTMIHRNSVARISDAEFLHMGQAGVLARYPIHFHVAGDMSSSYIRRASIHDSQQRCITIHGTHSVRVSDTVGFDIRGHCYFFEDAVETHNRLVCNLGFAIRRPRDDKRLIPSDEHPAVFWVSNPNNTLIGNVAAGSEGNGFWYDMPESSTGLHSNLGIHPRTTRMGVFRNNVAHSNTDRDRVFRNGTGLLIEDYQPPAKAGFTGLTSYKNSGFGVWAEGVTVANAVLAGNEVGFLGRFATLRDSLAVGETANDSDIPWSMIGTGFYVDRSKVTNVTYANFRNFDWHHGAAIGSIVEQQTTVPRVSKARFIRSRRVRITPPWLTDGPRPAIGFRDTDGSVLGTGKPSTIVASNPLLTGRGCRRNSAIDGSVCGPKLKMTLLRMVDLTGSSRSLQPAKLVRGDGAVAQTFPGHEWYPMAETSVRMGARYTFRPGRTTPRKTELTFANEFRGHVDVAIPWPHGKPFVYDGWGSWAEPIEPARTLAQFERGGRYLLRDGKVRVRFFNDDADFTWERQMVCARRGCGEGLGSSWH